MLLIFKSSRCVSQNPLAIQLRVSCVLHHVNSLQPFTCFSLAPLLLLFTDPRSQAVTATHRTTFQKGHQVQNLGKRKKGNIDDTCSHNAQLLASSNALSIP